MSFKDLPIMKFKKKSVLLFYPYVSKKSAPNIKKKLSGRWLGQGPMVDKFEKDFQNAKIIFLHHAFCFSFEDVVVTKDVLHSFFVIKITRIKKYC